MTPTSERNFTTRERLLLAAADLFRSKGYHAVGLTELLQTAKAPKGSLYHHFPNGKPDLALAAAEWASDEMRRIMNDSFAQASSFQDGATTLCHKLAKLFDLTGRKDGCPVSGILVSDVNNAVFQGRAQEIYDLWRQDGIAYGTRLGLTEEEAAHKADHLFILLQGGWTMARAHRSSDVLRKLPTML